MSFAKRIAMGGLAGAGLLLVALLVFSGAGTSGPQTTLAQVPDDEAGPAAQEAPAPQVGNGDGTISAEAAAALQPASAAEFRPAEVFQGKMDHAAAGTGTRNTGYGNIRLRGVPPGSTVVKGFLYWGMICKGTTCPKTQTVSFDEKKFTGTLIATAPQPCWTGSLFGAYRADVTARIPPDINGDYEVDGLASALVTGKDPWLPIDAGLPMSEGATLLVVYSNGSLPPSVTYLHHGAVFLGGAPVTISNALAPVLPGAILKSTRFGADGQVGFSTAASPAISDEFTFIGPTGGPLTQIAGNGSAFNQNSDWNGEDATPLNQLWDTRTSKVDSTIPAGAASYDVTYVSGADCMDVIGHVLTAK